MECIRLLVVERKPLLILNEPGAIIVYMSKIQCETRLAKGPPNLLKHFWSEEMTQQFTRKDLTDMTFSKV